MNFYFGLSGRLSRKAYWLYVMLPYIGLAIVATIIDEMFFADFVTRVESSTASPYVKAAIFTIGVSPANIVLVIVASWPLFATGVRRLHDLGRGVAFALISWFATYAAFYALMFVATDFMVGDPAGAPIPSVPVTTAAGIGVGMLIGVWAGLLMLFWPGADGANRYGPDPLRAG